MAVEGDDGGLQLAASIQGELVDGGGAVGVTIVTTTGTRCHVALTPQGAAKLISLLGNLAASAFREGNREWGVVSGGEP